MGLSIFAIMMVAGRAMPDSGWTPRQPIIATCGLAVRAASGIICSCLDEPVAGRLRPAVGRVFCGLSGDELVRPQRAAQRWPERLRRARWQPLSKPATPTDSNRASTSMRFAHLSTSSMRSQVRWGRKASMKSYMNPRRKVPLRKPRWVTLDLERWLASMLTRSCPAPDPPPSWPQSHQPQAYVGLEHVGVGCVNTTLGSSPCD